MADGENTSNTTTVAIVAIVLLVIIAGVIAWQMGVFNSGGNEKHKVDINVNTPSTKGTP